MNNIPRIHIDMEYIEDEHVVCLTDNSPWDDYLIKLHNDVMMEKIISALQLAFTKQHMMQMENIKITPTVRIIFAREPVDEALELLNKSTTIFENCRSVLQWEYCQSENSEQETDDDTNIPDDQ